jgi:LacI family transcriptional regulator
MPKPRRVALLIDTSTSWGIRLIKGINKYAQEVGNWLIYIEPRGRYEIFGVPTGWGGDGIIARITREELADEIVATGLPAVNVSWFAYQGPMIARCTVDEQESGRISAEYFLSNGFENFAYCGTYDRSGYVDKFGESYKSVIAAAGHECRIYKPPEGKGPADAWNIHLASLAKWLKSLPKPVALLCWNAARGRQVTEACHYAGLRVPDQVAVLGGEYDDLMSHISNPPLSTLDQPSEQVGFAAAEMLASMMSGRKPPTQPLLFSPTRIVVRQSTDTVAIDDELIREAITLIRQRASEGICVADVVRRLAVARRTLEQRFIRLMGRTPAAEIRRVRIEVAKRLLIESDKSVAQVARASGFSQQDLFSRTFRRSVGVPPSDFRRQHQRSGKGAEV